MNLYDYYLSGPGGVQIGNLLQASRIKAADEWRPNIGMFYPKPADLAAMPERLVAASNRVPSQEAICEQSRRRVSAI